MAPIQNRPMIPGNKAGSFTVVIIAYTSPSLLAHMKAVEVCLSSVSLQHNFQITQRSKKKRGDTVNEGASGGLGPWERNCMTVSCEQLRQRLFPNY